jgi:hypothetical protein
MSLVDQVTETLARASEDATNGKAIAEAERLADQFADVKPTPYVIPIERFVGMTVERALERPILHA